MAPQVISILGGGSWGTALAIALAPRFEAIHLWVHNPELAATLHQTRENPRYLPGLSLPPNVHVSSQFTPTLWALAVVPSRHLAMVLSAAQAHFTPATRIISATKGIEAQTFRRMSQLAAAAFPAATHAALSGPTFAREIAAGQPAAMVIASPDEAFAHQVQHSFAGGHLRLYTNPDLTGVELSGALKNCIAIAAGAVEGLGLGSNSLAALITRGLAEISRLVVASGGRAETVAGLAGLGDLVLTCTGQLSRNRRVGVELAKGRPLADILADSPMVAEGVETTHTALTLAATHGIEMPILEAVAAMLNGTPALTVLRQLLSRAPRSEFA